MYVVGHVSVAQLLAWAPGRAFDARQSAWVILGALLPDIIDKSIRVLGIYPWGRTVGHSLLVWSLLALFSALLAGSPRSWSRLIALGGASHLLMDFLDDAVQGVHFTGYAVSAWFTWPYLNPDLYPIIVNPVFFDRPCLGLYSMAEALVVALVLTRAREPEIWR